MNEIASEGLVQHVFETSIDHPGSLLQVEDKGDNSTKDGPRYTQKDQDSDVQTLSHG
jgi:hypothetical protein